MQGQSYMHTPFPDPARRGATRCQNTFKGKVEVDVMLTDDQAVSQASWLQAFRNGEIAVTPHIPQAM